MQNAKLLQEILEEALKTEVKTARDLQKIKNRLAKKHKLYSVSNYELNKFYAKSDLPQTPTMKKLLQKRQVRSMSGV